QARTEHRSVVLHDVEWHAKGADLCYLDIHVVPLTDAEVYLGAGVSFADVSGAKRLQRELEHARQELETAYEELQSTNEELETTNEELQATNEELTTMNEELQATNEELTAMNDEVRHRSEQLS